MDEALGRPFQDTIVTAVNSFYKQPLVEIEQVDAQADDDDREEDVEMEEDREPGNAQ